MAGTKRGSSCAVHNNAQLAVDARLYIVLQVIHGLEVNRELFSQVHAF